MGQYNYSSLVKTFEAYLSTHPPEGIPDSLYEPVRYINQLGGKRIRPVLLLMAYNLWHEDVTPALPAALAIEYFHNFSLMHDDIMDEASLRRGKDSVHIRYGKNAALLSGDAMLIKCFRLLLDAGSKNNSGAELSLHMADTATAICEGQQLDMDFEKMDSVSESEYLEMIRKKTACLIGLSLQMGALLAEADKEEAEALYLFGENLGMAFQIRDDFLDVFGEAQRTGKQPGGDILQGKKNFLYVRTFNSLDQDKQEEFRKLYTEASRINNIEKVINFYRTHGIEEYTRQTEDMYFARAVHSLQSLSTSTPDLLHSFAREIFVRDH